MIKLKAFFKKFKNPIFVFLGLLFIFFLWFVTSLLVNSTLYPGPIDTFVELFALLGNGETYLAVLGTVGRMLIAFAISFVLGAIFGTLAGYFKWFHTFLKPLILILRTLPTAAAVLILVVLLKPAMTPIIVTCLVIFPIIYEAFVSGINNVEEPIIDSLKIDGGTGFKSYFKIYLPASASYIILAVVQSLGLGMKVSIMAEILAPSERIASLGRLINYEYQLAEIKPILAYSIIAIVIISIIDIALHIIRKKLKIK